MQEINWYTLSTSRERLNKLVCRVNKVLEDLPITQAEQGINEERVLKDLDFEMVGSIVDPEKQQIYLVLRAKE